MTIDDEMEMYFTASLLSSYKRKVERAAQTIQDALKIPGGWMISYSSGKDSTVLLDILCKSGWKGLGYHAVCSKYEDPAENIALSKKSSEKYGVDISVVKSFGEYDAWKAAGYFFTTPETPEEKRLARLANSDFKQKSREFMQSNNIRNYFLGLTKAESRGRKISLSSRGNTYQLKTGEWVCCPLADWTPREIWAYIVSNGLEYLSVYDTPGFSREQLRNELTVMYTSGLVRRGIMLQYKMSYPALFRSLKKEFPEAGLYA